MLTPYKLTRLIEAKNEQIKRDDYRAGILAMVVRSALGAKNVHPFDFFPQHKDTPDEKSRGITKAAEVRANMRAYIEGMKIHGEKATGG